MRQSRRTPGVSRSYCIKHQLGVCPRGGNAARHDEPLALIDTEGRRLELRFDCRRYEMQLWLDGCSDVA